MREYTEGDDPRTVDWNVTARVGRPYVKKYVDERGNTMYTDKPIPGAERVTTVAPRPPEAAARSYAEQQSASNNQLAASNQRLAQGQDNQRIAANVAKDLAASRAARCKQARDEYAKTIRSMTPAWSGRSTIRSKS